MRKAPDWLWLLVLAGWLLADVSWLFPAFGLIPLSLLAINTSNGKQAA